MSHYNDDLKEYFEKVLNFLKKEDWIFNYPNTHILVNQVLDNFPIEWRIQLQSISNDDLNKLPFGDVDGNWPESLQNLLFRIRSLKHEVALCKPDIEVVTLEPHLRLSVKKAHEIISLAAVIHNACQKHNISVLVDIGAGLGYLSHLLHKKYNYRILAIEGSSEKVDLAIKHQNKFYPHARDGVKFLRHFITENSSKDIEAAIKQHNWNTENVGIVGLHACADLSVTVFEIFQKLDFVNVMVLMPCCYHRMEELEITSHDERFKRFPVSNALKSVYSSINGEAFLRRPFLRLACQQTGINWKCMSVKEHDLHSKSCMFRAILQEVAQEGTLDVKRLKRKTGKFKASSDYTIEDYVNNLKNSHKLVNIDGVQVEFDSNFTRKMVDKWEEHKENCYLVEILTALQTAIQSICENIVLLDRVHFLRENGINCDIYKVTDDRISPRCHALLATK